MTSTCIIPSTSLASSMAHHITEASSSKATDRISTLHSQNRLGAIWLYGTRSTFRLSDLEEDRPLKKRITESAQVTVTGKEITTLMNDQIQKSHTINGEKIRGKDMVTSHQLTTALTTDDVRKRLIMAQRKKANVAPMWHPKWKNHRVIAGHTGWVRCLAVDCQNEWFASGSADKTIKIWDLASGTLKLTLTAHVNTVRALAISARRPYMFSAGEDHSVKCWDLEQNKVIRNYHGHLSGVYSLALHPTLDILISGGRDSTARVWDMRTKQEIAVLSGHTSTVCSIVSQASEPQIITSSHDSTIRLWDLAKIKTTITLTHHKKSVRSLALHPTEYTFASAAPESIKIWKCPEGTFLRNVLGHKSIINGLAINHENVLVSGGDDGSLHFWDWKSGHNFQTLQTIPQPGSLEAENGVLGLTFDQTGSRLLTAGSDKAICVYREENRD